MFRRWPHEIGLLAVLFVVVLAIWGFIALADEMVEGDTKHLDEQIILRFRSPIDSSIPIGPAWLRNAARDVTALGSHAVLLLLVFASAGLCAVTRHFRRMLLILVASLGGMALSHLLKSGFARARPEIVPHLTEVMTYSFPSGHSMLSAAVFLSLAVVLMQITPGHLAKIYVLAIALTLTGLVGMSRIYLGVHYPSDVLAGWSVGLAWALLCWLVSAYLEYRGVIRKTE